MLGSVSYFEKVIVLNHVAVSRSESSLLTLVAPVTYTDAHK